MTGYFLAHAHGAVHVLGSRRSNSTSNVLHLTAGREAAGS